MEPANPPLPTPMNFPFQFSVGSHISMFDVRARALLDQIRNGFIARGMDSVAATRAAYAALSGMVSQQAVMVSFVQLFRILALVFAIVRVTGTLRWPTRDRSIVEISLFVFFLT